MSGTTEGNVEFGVFGDASDREGSSREKTAPIHMGAADRVALYLAVAGLLDCGFGLKEATHLLANEFKASGRRMAAASTETFFGGLSAGSDVSGAAQLAEGAFGKGFVGVEEMALLRAMPSAPSQASLLRSLASLVTYVASARQEGPVARVLRG